MARSLAVCHAHDEAFERDPYRRQGANQHHPRPGMLLLTPHFIAAHRHSILWNRRYIPLTLVVQ